MYSNTVLILGMVLIWLLVGTWIDGMLLLVHANDDYDNYVQEVIHENQQLYNDYSGNINYNDEDDTSSNMYYHHHHDGMNNNTFEENNNNILQDEQQQRQQQKQAAEEEEEEEKERLLLLQQQQQQQEREDAFAAELERMESTKKRAAIQQKRLDGKIVNHVLRAAQKDDYYNVLRLRNYNGITLQTPALSFTIPFWNKTITLPSIPLFVFHISNKDIKRAYRDMAKRTHPDKNRDGRANAAFVAVEYAASVLLNESQREQYDAQIRQRHIQWRNDIATKTVQGAVHTSRSIVQSISVLRNVLGPCAFPVSIVTILLL